MRRLIIRPGAIGDCILSFPALEHLRAEYTEIWISSPVAPLVHFADVVRPLASTGIDLVAVGDLETPATLKAKLQSFDSIVSWYGANRKEFRDEVLRLGVDCRFFAALPPPGYGGHATDLFAAQTGAPPGLLPRLSIRRLNPKNQAVIHPFSGSPRKNWRLDFYREMAGRLPQQVRWTAGPEEQLEEATRFASLQELADWMAGSQLYIGNDSGITHVAAATGIPVLALFGPASSRTWIPRGPNVTVLECNALDELKVETVLAAANRLLGLR